MLWWLLDIIADRDLAALGRAIAATALLIALVMWLLSSSSLLHPF
jgi:hypothetical protein